MRLKMKKNWRRSSTNRSTKIGCRSIPTTWSAVNAHKTLFFTRSRRSKVNRWRSKIQASCASWRSGASNSGRSSARRTTFSTAHRIYGLKGVTTSIQCSCGWKFPSTRWSRKRRRNYKKREKKMFVCFKRNDCNKTRKQKRHSRNSKARKDLRSSKK